jgi:hypothetical protein
MMATIATHNGLKLYELSSGGALLGEEMSATDLIGDTYMAEPDIIVVPVDRLAPAFLDLKSRVAGEVFQKCETYGHRLAIVGDISHQVAASKALHDFVFETNRRGRHLFAPDRESLLARLP